MKANCLLIILAFALALSGIVNAQTHYPAPYECVFYYNCARTESCQAANGNCQLNNIPYNHYVQVGQDVGMCLYESGNGCDYWNGNLECWIRTFYSDPPGAACVAGDEVCYESEDDATGCDY